MTDNTEYTSESDILDSFVYNLLPIFLFTTNFLDDNLNYTNSIGRRIFDDAIFLGTPFIGTLILLWIKSDDIIWPSILYTIHLSFFIIYFVATRAWLNHGKLNQKNLTHEEDVKHIKYVYEKIIWKVWIHRILFLLTMSQIILIIFNLVFMYKFFPKRHSTKIDYKYYIWVVFPCFVAIFYSIVQSLIVYRKEEDEKDKENKKDEVNMENMEDVEDVENVENVENEKDKENIKNEVNMDNMENKEDEEDESKNKKLIETITRFIIWSILHGIIVTELWIFPISAYFTKFYLLLYINCVTLIFRYDSPKGIKFGVGFLNFIFIENSNNFKENSHLPVKYFFYLDHMDKDKNKENKDFVHNNRFKNIRSLYLR
ncbi:hypothetical protein RhiirB3_386898 [Rhizophagus irregularis]|nr:hypothetical protein RhiirB3_386898 [Rhizophagus irregularis]